MALVHRRRCWISRPSEGCDASGLSSGPSPRSSRSHRPIRKDIRMRRATLVWLRHLKMLVACHLALLVTGTASGEDPEARPPAAADPVSEERLGRGRELFAHEWI